MSIKIFYLKLINLLFPIRCFVCFKYFDYIDDLSVCHFCVDQLKKDKEIDKCLKCGNILKNKKCLNCLNNKSTPAESLFFSFYNWNIGKKLIYESKFNKRKEIIKTLSFFLLKEEEDILYWADAYLPIINSKQNSKKRGYCFVTEVVRILSKKANKKIIYPVIFHKKREIQHFLSRKDRKKNAERMFEFDIKKLKKLNEKKKLLIIDDIYTTGATVHSYVKELKKFINEDHEIRIFTFSRTPYG